MPSSSKPETVPATDAFEDLQELLGQLEDHGATHDELDLLNDVLGDSEYQALAEVYDVLGMKLPEFKDEHAHELIGEILDMLHDGASYLDERKELIQILLRPHFKALIETHDDVASKIYDDVFLNSLELSDAPPAVFDEVPETHRFVTLRKNGKQPLGITVRLDDRNDLVIARILQDSLASKQSLLRVGDIVKAVNGTAVFVPEDMKIVLEDAQDTVTIKIVPSAVDNQISDIVFVKACINYDPMTDRLIPCMKAGLPFREGDILALVDHNDENWWQAKLADLPNGPVGLIPSRTLQEKRQAYVMPQLTKTRTNLLCGLKTKKKKKIRYNSSDTNDFDGCDIRVYEEVERSVTNRCTLILVGANGVGKRSLKERLIRQFPEKYAAAIPDTSRPMGPKEEDGRGYFFVKPSEMEANIKKNLYIDHGEFGGHLFGTRISTIRDTIRSGKICVLDISARSLKFLLSPEFRPFVVFIAAPSVEALKVMERKGKRMTTNNNERRGHNPKELFMEEKFIRVVRESQQIERLYKGMYEEVIVNDDFNTTYQTLLEQLQNMENSHKWVPKDWNLGD